MNQVEDVLICHIRKLIGTKGICIVVCKVTYKNHDCLILLRFSFERFDHNVVQFLRRLFCRSIIGYFGALAARDEQFFQKVYSSLFLRHIVYRSDLS